MQRWHLGYILRHPVEIFISDDYCIFYGLSDNYTYPHDILETCERIMEQSKSVGSLTGAQRVLRDNGWSDSYAGLD